MIDLTVSPTFGKLKGIKIIGADNIFTITIPIFPGDYKKPGIVEILIRSIIADGFVSYTMPNKVNSTTAEMTIKDGKWKETTVGLARSLIEVGHPCSLTLKYIA